MFGFYCRLNTTKRLEISFEIFTAKSEKNLNEEKTSKEPQQ